MRWTMIKRLVGFTLLFVIGVFLWHGSLSAQHQAKSKMTVLEIVSKKVCKDVDIPDMIILPDGSELSVLRSARTKSEIIAWSDKYNALLSISQGNVTLAIVVDTENGVWALLSYKKQQQWTLATVTMVKVPGGVPISSIVHYPTEDSVLVLTKSGSMLVGMGTDKLVDTGSLPLADNSKALRESPCQYEYMGIPTSLSISPQDKPESVILAAKNRVQIANWADSHNFIKLLSIGPDHLVILKDIGSGTVVSFIAIYVRNTADKDDDKPWKLACVGNIGTYVYFPVVMYIDRDTHNLVLLGTRGDKIPTLSKIGLMKLSNFTIFGKL